MLLGRFQASSAEECLYNVIICMAGAERRAESVLVPTAPLIWFRKGCYVKDRENISEPQ